MIEITSANYSANFTSCTKALQYWCVTIHIYVRYCFQYGNGLLLPIWEWFTASSVGMVYCFRYGNGVLLPIREWCTASDMGIVYCFRYGNGVLLPIWELCTASDMGMVYCFRYGNGVLLPIWDGRVFCVVDTYNSCVRKWYFYVHILQYLPMQQSYTLCLQTLGLFIMYLHSHVRK
jgi:hypothetical protein